MKDGVKKVKNGVMICVGYTRTRVSTKVIRRRKVYELIEEVK